MRILTIVGLLVISLQACVSWGWPQWTEDLISSLDCGMTILEVQSLAGQRPEPVMSNKSLHIYGTHAIYRDAVSVWLHFEGGRLLAASRWRPESWKLKSIYKSPKRNLCTGETVFFFRLVDFVAIQDFVVYVDGKKIDHFQWRVSYEISIGSHELRIEKEGYKPVIKKFHFTEGGRGELRITITDDDLVRVDHPDGMA